MLQVYALLLACILCATSYKSGIIVRNKCKLSSLFVTPVSEDVSSSTRKRKEHKNKYSLFSKKSLDPLSKAIAEKEAEEKESQEKSSRQRGISLPIPREASKSTNSTTIKTKSNRSPISVASINPSDPSTFGYTEIGSVVSAHGIKGEVKAIISSDFAHIHLSAESILYLRKPGRRSPRPLRVVSSRKMVGIGGGNTMYLIQFEGVKNRIISSSLKLFTIFAKKLDRDATDPQLSNKILEEDEYFISDLTGCMCYHYSDNDTDAIDNKPFAIVEGVVPPDELHRGVVDNKKSKEDEQDDDADDDEEDDTEESERVYLSTLNITNISKPPRKSSHSAHLHGLLEIRLLYTKDLCLIPFVPALVPKVDIANKIIHIQAPPGLLDCTYRIEEKVVIRGLLESVIERLTAEDRWLLNERVRLLYKEGGEFVPFI